MAIKTVTRQYSGFRGIDLRGDECELFRSPDALNIWRDYKYSEGVRTRPSPMLHTAVQGRVWGIFFYRDCMLVHSGNTLYSVDADGNVHAIYVGVSERKSSAFIYDGMWYFKDGVSYLVYDGESIENVCGYVPTTSIARKPSGGGERHEDVNMLSPFRKNSFLSDGASYSYQLDAYELDEDHIPEVEVNGTVLSSSEYNVNYSEGRIIFKYVPSQPLTDGADNVIVKFKKTVRDAREKILSCSIITVFDNRVFFSGSAISPNCIWHSSLNDPTYVSDLDYYEEGRDTAAVRGLCAGNNALWVFREPCDANTTIFYHIPSIDEEYGKIYPSAHSSIALGCVGGAINFNDDIVFFSPRGMEGISSDITTEQAVSHRSSLVDRRLTQEAGYRDMLLCEWQGYLLVIIGKSIYLADSRAKTAIDGHVEYEWFYWELEHEISAVSVHDGRLYLGYLNGIYTLDGESDVLSYIVTAKDKFGYPNMQKTASKHGCAVEAVGNITMYARREGGEFEPVGEFFDVSDYFTARVKLKNFKDIQLKFASSDRFSLESATLCAYVGGYLKM